MVNRERLPLRGEIWWVDLDPVVGSEQRGRRPALIISSDDFQRVQNRLVAVLPITRTHRGFRLHVEFSAEDAGLEHPGAIMCDQIRIVSMSRLLGRTAIGNVSARTMREVEDLVRVLLDL